MTFRSKIRFTRAHGEWTSEHGAGGRHRHACFRCHGPFSTAVLLCLRTPGFATRAWNVPGGGGGGTRGVCHGWSGAPPRGSPRNPWRMRIQCASSRRADGVDRIYALRRRSQVPSTPPGWAISFLLIHGLRVRRMSRRDAPPAATPRGPIRDLEPIPAPPSADHGSTELAAGGPRLDGARRRRTTPPARFAFPYPDANVWHAVGQVSRPNQSVSGSIGEDL